jgi:hypothetical protein
MIYTCVNTAGQNALYLVEMKALCCKTDWRGDHFYKTRQTLNSKYVCCVKFILDSVHCLMYGVQNILSHSCHLEIIIIIRNNLC